MQIGEFAKICNTNISLLRHYDKVGLLVPDYVDPFTGYRHYSVEQIVVFNRITALKQAGFSLREIKRALEALHSDNELVALFEKKKADIKQTLKNLDLAKKTIVDGRLKIDVNIVEENGKLRAETTQFDVGVQSVARIITQNILVQKEYQRISTYRIGNRDSKEVYLVCDVVKIGDKKVVVKDDINLPFENDDVVGKWQIIGEYAVKEDFYDDMLAKTDYYGETVKELYFLPEGQWYWCYSWTKGRLLGRFGNGATSVNEYTTEDYNGSRYMFVNMKSYNFRMGGYPTVVVLKRIDNKEYSVEETAKKDKIDFPFVNDAKVLGKWRVYDFCRTVESFEPLRPYNIKFLWTGVEFFENGDLAREFNYGKRVVSDRSVATWTKGIISDYSQQVACAYELHRINTVEYLFVQWKTGDYVYGGMEPQYYVFVRDS